MHGYTQHTALTHKLHCSLHVHFVHDEISPAALLKNGSGCLHVAICQAGVQESFAFVSHIQTGKGITSIPLTPEKHPTEPGAYLARVGHHRHICTPPSERR